MNAEECGTALITTGRGEDFPLMTQMVNMMPELTRQGAILGILSKHYPADAKPWTVRDPEFQSAQLMLNQKWLELDRENGTPAIQVNMSKLLTALCGLFPAESQTQLVAFASSPRFAQIRPPYDAMTVSFMLPRVSSAPIDQSKTAAIRATATKTLATYAKNPEWNAFLASSGKSAGLDIMMKGMTDSAARNGGASIGQAAVSDSLGSAMLVIQQITVTFPQIDQLHQSFLTRTAADQIAAAAAARAAPPQVMVTPPTTFTAPQQQVPPPAATTAPDGMPIPPPQ